jgi:hypothetical protein
MYVNQLAIWVTTLIELGGVPVTDLFVHAIAKFGCARA